MTKGKRAPTVVGIERWSCMCGAENRQCPHCGWPFEVADPEKHQATKPDAGAHLVHCIKCGQITTEADTVSPGVARGLRLERGLIP